MTAFTTTPICQFEFPVTSGISYGLAFQSCRIRTSRNRQENPRNETRNYSMWSFYSKTQNQNYEKLLAGRGIQETKQETILLRFAK
jgi:hypothetical protein